jgi:hypothetical protein
MPPLSFLPISIMMTALLNGCPLPIFQPGEQRQRWLSYLEIPVIAAAAFHFTPGHGDGSQY